MAVVSKKTYNDSSLTREVIVIGVLITCWYCRPSSGKVFIVNILYVILCVIFILEATADNKSNKFYIFKMILLLMTIFMLLVPKYGHWSILLLSGSKGYGIVIIVDCLITFYLARYTHCYYC